MVSSMLGRTAAGIVAALAIASLNVAAVAAPTPVTGGHTFGQGTSGPGTGREQQYGRPQNQNLVPAHLTNAQTCGYAQPGLIDTNGDLMMAAAPPSPYNTVGSLYAGGPTLLSFFGYGNASLSSWWMSPAGQIAAQMGLSPLASGCGSPAMFLPDGW